jgi:CheY-like chemotaxis protein
VPHTLLLADDSVTIQRVIELTFADEDIRVVAVSDGDQAIAAVDKNPPDIVLADVGMPGRTGYEVAQHIRATPHLAHIPVLLLTGAFEPVDQALAQQAGCDGVLAKPFEPQLVIGRVKELLARPRGHNGSSLVAAAPVALAPEPPSAAAALPQNGGWANPFSEPPPVPQGVPAPPSDDVSNYFDRLDQAFASFSEPAAAAPPAASPALDWFGGGKTEPTPAPDIPLSYGSPQAAFEPAAAPVEPPVPMAPPMHFAPPPRPAAAAPVIEPLIEPMPAASAMPPALPVASGPTFPPLEQAFEALLTAEQAAGAPAFAPAWPSAPEPPVVDTDAIVARVSAHVLEQLSDRVVRERVGEIVSQIAERLIREEIDKIKERIK